MDKEKSIAIDALYYASTAIKKVCGVKRVTVDSDNDSGKILFKVGDRSFKMKVEEVMEVEDE